MTHPSVGRFVAIVLLAVAAAHFAVAVAAATALQRWYPHRIFNVRAWANSGPEGFKLVGTFLRENVDPSGPPTVVFAGSSVTYGYPWDERFVFSTVFANRRPDLRVLNASIVAADITGINQWIICEAHRNGIHVDALVVEIPIVNTTAHLVSLHKRGDHDAAVGSCEQGSEDPGYLELALTQPRGISWLPFFWNRENVETVESKLHLAPVPAGYFTSRSDFAEIRDSFSQRIVTTLSNAKGVATSVYAFPSPVLLSAAAEIGEDADALREQMQASLDACATVSGVHCIDPFEFYSNESLFLNLTHLNQAGHRAMAEFLLARVQPARADH